MNRSFTRVPVLALALALMSAPALAQHVDTDYDRSTNFGAFKTFAIGTIKMSEDTSPLMMQRIVGAVEGNMRVLGLRRVETNPDIVISIQGDTRDGATPTGGAPDRTGAVSRIRTMAGTTAGTRTPSSSEGSSWTSPIPRPRRWCSGERPTTNSVPRRGRTNGSPLKPSKRSSKNPPGAGSSIATRPRACGRTDYFRPSAFSRSASCSARD